MKGECSMKQKKYPERRGLEDEEINTIGTRAASVTIFNQYIQELTSLDRARDDYLLTKSVCSYFAVIWTHYNCYSTHQNLVFQPTLYKFITLGSLDQDPIHLGLELQNVSLQLAPSVGRTCVIVRVTVRYGRLKGSGGGFCYGECLFSLHNHCGMTLAP